jgi:hypothetical protein
MATNEGGNMLVFEAGGKQHERLGIPKEGLPHLSDAEFGNLLTYLWRYEETLGIGGPGDVSEAEAAQDTEVLAEIIASRYEVFIGEARAMLERTAGMHRSGRGHEIDNEGSAVFWAPDDALAFVKHLSGASSAVAATFLYIFQCDELAAGLFEADEGWIQDTYEWALAHTSRRSE